jgi:shikimate dehydrogenase
MASKYQLYLTKTDKYGLIGHPINHSLSPALFRAGFNGLYRYDLIEDDDFKRAFERFHEEYDAINVTSPFKETACQNADVLSAECKAIEACNVLMKTADGILAANTDFTAVIKCLIPHQVASTVPPITVVVGCGGAGKAAAYAACELGNKVIILNRTLSKAEQFAEHLSQINNRYDVMAKPIEEFCKWFKKAGTVIYTLPLPIGQLEKLKKSDIRGHIFGCKPKVILEANYKSPSFTEPMLKALQTENPKISYINGKEWLLEQAIEAFSLFTGREPNIQEMIKVI